MMAVWFFSANEMLDDRMKKSDPLIYNELHKNKDLAFFERDAY